MYGVVPERRDDPLLIGVREGLLCTANQSLKGTSGPAAYETYVIFGGTEV